MLVRMFGIFGIVLGAAYFMEGIAFIGLLPFALSQGARQVFFTYMMFVAWDFLFGASLIVAGIGVLLLKEWARIMWLGLVPALVLVHFGLIVFNELFRGGVSSKYLIWTGMVVAAAALSGWYLTQTRIRARFARRTEQPEVNESSLT